MPEELRSGHPRTVHRCRSHEYLQGRGTWIRMTWNDRTRQLTLEPSAPEGATNLPVTRTFRALLLPAGTSKEVTYSGKRMEIRF